ncbi:MAG: zinc-ribbon domain containing protein [Syntrophorhabdaceae bacterium]
MNGDDRNERFRNAARQFAQKAAGITEVKEVALCGSVAGNDPDPYDIDVAAMLTDMNHLPDVARFARQISGISHAWEVFVFDENLVYRGRICHRSKCPAQSIDCSVPGCGRIPHLLAEPDFEFDEKQFFHSPFEILHQATTESCFLKHRKRLGILSPRTYTPLKAVKVECIDCGRRFTIDAGEQKWYEKKGFSLPKRCPRCRSNDRY